MLNRLIKPLKSNSFFIFGARGTGKSTFIQDYLRNNNHTFDLLDPETFDLLLTKPKYLEHFCIQQKHEWIVIDEVQRIPKLLNSVHRLIENQGQKFALTGSSSRKLRRGGANLLAGRAFLNTLFPLSCLELKEEFELEHTLQWGSLPKLLSLKDAHEKRAYLRSYCLAYIREEIQMEQAVRNLEPFREFLAVAAQSSGKIINFSSIGRDVGAQVPTVQNYFQILEDTFTGFFLPHFHRSVRKSQIGASKFYIFDNGVKKALEGSFDSLPIEGTSQFGELFEAWVIQEIFKLNSYFEKDFRVSYFATKNGAEIDLILSKAKQTILIEIKSAKKVDELEVRKLARLADAFKMPNLKLFYLSRDSHEFEHDGVFCRNWRNFLESFAKL